MDRKIISFDFDGVIHSYTSGWKGDNVVLDTPVPGIKEAIAEIRASGYSVFIHSCRCNTPLGRFAVIAWLRDNEIEVDAVVTHKPLAVVHIDDRCICFDGKPADLLNKIQSFQPWYRQEHLPWDIQNNA